MESTLWYVKKENTHIYRILEVDDKVCIQLRANLVGNFKLLQQCINTLGFVL